METGGIELSISKQLASVNSMRLIIPYAGKMLRSNISAENRALCFCINKGYIESDTLEPLYYFVETVKESNSIWLYLVGKIDKIHLNNERYCYRQRVFFYSFINMCELCKKSGIIIQTANTFRITINTIINCTEDLQYLEWYANSFEESIDTYLTNTCKVQIYNLISSKKMTSPLQYEVDAILVGKTAYLERAPFLVCSYDVRNHTSSVFINKNNRDTRMYRIEKLENLDLYGFTEGMVEKDKQAGVFKHEGKI